MAGLINDYNNATDQVKRSSQGGLPSPRRRAVVHRVGPGIYGMSQPINSSTQMPRTGRSGLDGYGDFGDVPPSPVSRYSGPPLASAPGSSRPFATSENNREPHPDFYTPRGQEIQSQIERGNDRIHSSDHLDQANQAVAQSIRSQMSGISPLDQLRNGRQESRLRQFGNNLNVYDSFGYQTPHINSVRDTSDAGLAGSISRIQRRNSGDTFGNNLLAAQRQGVPIPGSMNSPTGATYGGVTPQTYDQELGMARAEQQARIGATPKYNDGNRFVSTAGGRRTVTVGRDDAGVTTLTGSGYTPEDRDRFQAQKEAGRARTNRRDQAMADSRVLYNQKKYGLPDHLPAVADARQRAGLPVAAAFGGSNQQAYKLAMDSHLHNLQRVRQNNDEIHKKIHEHKMKGPGWFGGANAHAKELQRLESMIEPEPQFTSPIAGGNRHFGGPTNEQQAAAKSMGTPQGGIQPVHPRWGEVGKRPRSRAFGF